MIQFAGDFTCPTSGALPIQKYTIKAYECKICGKVFGYSSNLNSHMQTYTGEKLYQCKICRKSFTTSSSLTEHFRIHTGEKTYKCKECGKAFTKHPGLSTHVQTHAEQKPYVWEILHYFFKDD